MRQSKRIFLYNDAGLYVGTDLAYESPREPGVFHSPDNSTDIQPPEGTEKKSAYWEGKKWKLKDDPEKMSREERVKAGLEKREKGYKANGEPATIDEQVAFGDISPEVAYSIKLRDVLSARQSAYMWESDPILAQYLRGEATKEEWLDKIEEIKKRLPKPKEYA